MSASAQTYEFRSEARQVLDLVIHSLYSKKEIFLRELISNASDAIDKRRFEALKDGALGANGYEIRIQADAAARTLTVDDDGVGMSRDEIVENLGTIARSGTRAFLDALKGTGSDAGLAELIGQFGVGFYSAFMVAERITALSRRAGQEGAVCWESTGDGTFTVEDAARDAVGTSVTLHLKGADDEEGLEDYADEWTIRRIVRTYSDFVTHPIRLLVTREGEPPKEGEEPAAPTVEWQTINSRKAIWTRPAEEVSEEEYQEFFRHVSHHMGKPLTRVAWKAEGTFEYQVLAFVPEQPPWDLFHYDAAYGLQLYANRVLIMEHARDLLPRYLRFLSGVVESADLPLNVSREFLQNDRRVKQIRARVVKKTLDALADLRKDDGARYASFWEGFGKVLKEGVPEDREHHPRLVPLLEFDSTADPKARVTLPEYVARMAEGQDAIHYLTGDSRATLERSPHLEAFRAKGIEVLLLTDPVDELLVASLREWEGKPLRSVGRGQVDLGTEEERKVAAEARKEKEGGFKALLTAVRVALQEHVKEVRLSSRLTESAAVLVTDEAELDPHLTQLLKRAGQDVDVGKRILELNPDHALIQAMQARAEADEEDEAVAAQAHLLHGQALLAEGSPLPDPVDFARRVVDLMAQRT